MSHRSGKDGTHEAIRIINSMPDDAVGILVEFLKQMKVNDSQSNDRQATGNKQIQPHKRKLGIADGRYRIPDSIDACNDEIARMFGVAELLSQAKSEGFRLITHDSLITGYNEPCVMTI